MACHGYVEVDHTADIALRVWGENYWALLQQAAAGMYDLMGVVPIPDTSLDEFFVIPAGTHETVLVDFLSELLFLTEEHGQVLDHFSFSDDGNVLSIMSTGRKIHTCERHIKAVTFHNLTVKTTEAGLEVTITFDV